MAVKKATKKTRSDRAQVDAQRRAYLAAQPPEVRKRLKEIREMVRALAPDAEESFTYRMPGFRLDGRPLVWYAGFKHHVSLFPMTASIRQALAGALAGYKTSAGTVQFRLDKPLPGTLIKRLIKARIAEIR